MKRKPRRPPKGMADPTWSEVSEALGYGDLGGLLVFDNVREDLAE